MRIRVSTIIVFMLLAFFVHSGWAPGMASESQAFRPPAVPLVTCDPYFSIWSFADHLTYDSTRHWSGTPQPILSMARVDGKTYRIMGDTPRIVGPARQLSLRVLPTRTIYEFEAGGVEVRLTFMTPMLPKDLDVLSRPVTYLTWSVHSTDQKRHEVSIFYGNTAALVVNTPDEAVAWSEEKARGLDVARMGTEQQSILGKSGDRIRIDWGYLYVAAPQGKSVREAVGDERAVVGTFLSNGSLPAQMDSRMPRPAGDHPPSIGVLFDVGSVGAEPIERHLILAYDEIYPIEYFHLRLKPYWRRNNAQAEDLLESAENDYSRLRKECVAFDTKLMADLKQVGGEKYAEVAALAYRQSLAANKLAAAPDGKPLLFLKEISSCGCAQTVDVFYPEAPLLLLVNPKLLEYTLIPILDYATSGKWPYPYSPHDLGTYPLDNARVPSEMESMPVEESGNMLLLVAAIAKAEGNVEFASEHWPLLTQWAGYLKANGLDPANQLCTDDFTGHLAHNTNLSLKAIEAMGAYAMLAGMIGKKDVAADYRRVAEADARQWMKMADDGDHYRLAFDRPGTWSQKYNLIWDRVLGLNLFPPEVAQKELAFYRKQETAFGFPLDSRAAYTKLDWESWSAALSGSDQEFRTFFDRIYDFANETPTRVPLSDWYWTTDGTQTGFQARPVVGAVFIRMLTDPSLWRKWARAAN